VARNFNSIKTKYWEAARKKDLQADEIAVEFYLMTNPNCGPSGIQIAASSTIAYYLKLTVDQIDKILKSLAEKRRVVLSDGGWVWVVGKWEYEHTHTGQVVKAVISELEAGPDNLSEAFIEVYPNFTRGSAEPLEGLFRVSCMKGKERKGKEHGIESIRKGKDGEEFPQRFIDAVKHLFPDIDDKRAMQQAQTLEEIERLDGKPLDQLVPILKWATGDDFWSTNFRSCAGLRKKRNGPGDLMKWEKIESGNAAYQRANKSQSSFEQKWNEAQ